MMDTPRENSTHDSGVWLLDRIMNQMNAGVYITDVDTDEILFMNSGMKKQFGLVEPEGKICWQVLQKRMSGRCPFCPVPRLLRDGPSAAPLRWEEHNTSNGCIYENFDSLIQWHDGRLVHFQHSLNVTEYHKLSIAATTDELTGALNRRAGKAALAEMAAACARTGEPFSLCMFDVNDLKKTNDHFGHAAGDQLLVSIAAILAFTINEGYEAAAVMLIYQAGCIVRAYASALTKSSFRDRVDPYVASVTVLRGEEKTSIPPENVQLGDILILERGQRAPADLEILEGSVTLDLAPILGHTARREVTAGQKIPAGAVNSSAAVRCTVLAPASDSVFAREIDTVSDPEAVYGPEADSVERYARVYAPFALGVSVLIALLLLIFSTVPTEEAIHRALVLLIISCPTAFLAPLPFMYLAGLFRSLQSGVVVKDAFVLDGLSRAGAVVFDKDEMLSTGFYRVASVKSERLDPAVLLKVAAHAESGSSTAVAASIAKAYGQAIDASLIEEFTEEPDGITAVIDGIDIRMGDAAYMEKNGVTVTDPVGDSITVYMAVNDQYAGCIYLSDTIRDDARASFSAVSGAGCECIMLSADSPEKTRTAAVSAGVREYYAQCMPMDRLEKIQEIKERFPVNSVLYMGEANGDTACFNAADIGVCIDGLASETSMQTGSAVIMDKTAAPIAGAIDAAKATRSTVRQLILAVLAVKAVLLVLALLGVTYQLWFAAMVDTVAGIAGILYSSRIWSEQK